MFFATRQHVQKPLCWKCVFARSSQCQVLHIFTMNFKDFVTVIASGIFCVDVVQIELVIFSLVVKAFLTLAWSLWKSGVQNHCSRCSQDILFIIPFIFHWKYVYFLKIALWLQRWLDFPEL